MKFLKDISQKIDWNRRWQATKTWLYPYVKPAVLRYRALEAKHPRLAKVLLYTGLPAAGGLVFLLFFIFLIYIGAFGRLPSSNDLRNINNNISSEVYSADSVLLGKYFIENRSLADLADISPYITDALVATEDARFYEHGGIDLRAWGRVLTRSILMQDESAGGGSTLSQQLAKNLYPRRRFGPLTIPINKVKEMFIALRLEDIYTKDQILALYLNTVSFSDNVYGIRVATDRFFGKTPDSVKVEEAAVMIGMLKATSAYNPLRNPKRSQERRNTVMAQMVKYGKLDSMVFDSLKQLPIELRYNTESHAEGIGTYFREHLRLELEGQLKNFNKPDGRPYNIYTDGLKIYTTINSRMQQYAEEAVNDHMKDLQKIFVDHFKGYKDVIPYGSEELLQQTKKNSVRYKLLKEKGFSEADIDSSFARPVQMKIFTWDTTSFEKDTLMAPIDSIKYYLMLLKTGFLTAEPQTGKVLAWVGGINFKYFKYDHVKSMRQVGSTFKPFVYAKAIQNGISPCERILNEQVSFEDGYTPRNSDGSYGGSYSMQGGLRNSVNMVAINLIQRVGIDSVRALAKQMGIVSEIPREPGIALGGVDATLWEMVRAFSGFANRGLLPELYYLVRVETADGQVLIDNPAPDPNSFPRVLQQKHADMMIRLMQSVVDGGTGGRLRWVNNFIYPAAGKTGTSNNNVDGWFIGFTPNLVSGAWIGAEQPAVRFRATRLGQGGASALPIVGKFWKKVYDDPAFSDFKKGRFPYLDSLGAATFDCPDFIPGNESLLDSLRKYLDMPADSITDEERYEKVEKFMKYLKINGYEDFENLDTGDDAEADEEAEEEGNSDPDRQRAALPDDLRREAERVRRKNEKLERKRERQKKRKEILEKIFGGDG
jgi:penicillin-binding protein 1A